MTLGSFDMENAACGIAVLDDSMFFLAANATLAGMLQTDSASMVGQSLDQFLSGAHRLLFHMQAVTVLQVTGRVDEMVLSLTGTQGRPVPVLLSAISRMRDGMKVIECVIFQVNERKRLEDELFNIKKAVEQVPGMVYQYLRRADGSTCYPYVSDGVRTVYEILPVQLLNSAEKVLQRIHPEDRDSVERSIAASADNLSIWHQEYRVNLPERGLRWLEGHAAPEARVDGSVLWHGYIADVTDRHHQYQATDAQMQLLEACVSRLNDIVLITEAEPLDQSGPSIIYVNDAFVRRTGFSREEVIGKTPRILQGPKTQREELDRIGLALKRWEPVRAELINYTKAGQEFWLELDIVPVANAKGWFTHWIAVERDITQRKLAEVSMLESEKRHRSMFENNPQPMWVFDSNTLEFLSVNEAAVTCYGYSQAEFSRMTVRDIQSAEDLVRLEDRLATDMRKRSTHSEVWTHRRKDGSKLQVEISSHAIDFQGRPGELILANDVTEQLQSQAKIQYLAYHDTLTGLPNRARFLDFANQALRENTSGVNLSAGILFDLDNFKRINDHWGHRVGDELLKQVTLRVQQCLTPAAFLARLGGDEFIVLIADAGRDQAAASLAAQNLCSKIIVALAHGFTIDQRVHFTSASLGIALFGGAEMKVDELLSRADSAMYSAKAEGRNTFRFFDGQLQAQLAAQAELEGELRQCIQNNELHLVYQPQVDQKGRIVGSEVLLRWTQKQRGPVSPAQFIPVAESSGFILQIGQWVLHTACLALAKWQSEPATADLTVAVNVSAKQFHHPDFVNHVLSELESSGANPAMLKLELTESLLAQDLDGIAQKMHALRSRGVTFSLDDFGTGYSSLAYLKRLPLDQLKIDQGFVRDLLVDASDAAIVRTVIALADRLGLKVIAEGVETAAQREFLELNGCNFYQGYLFSRPLKQEDFEAFCSRA